jgi:HPt (histidine-containing phosphotransfer) domain-containing protein
MADAYIDVEEGKKRVANNAKLYVKLLTQFKDDEQYKIDPLFAAIEAGEWAAAEGQAHKIKGIAANLSMKELYAKIADLDAQLKAKVADPGAALDGAVVEAVKAAYSATIPCVEKVIAENG